MWIWSCETTEEEKTILINNHGKIEKYYDKINMFDVKVSAKEIHNESKIYKAGKKLALATTPWGKLGFTICFDLLFSALWVHVLGSLLGSI